MRLTCDIDVLPSDIDECKNKHNSCPSNSECINNIGGYTCECNDGYQMSIKTKSCVGLKWPTFVAEP